MGAHWHVPFELYAVHRFPASRSLFQYEMSLNGGRISNMK
jgi:hypothetical protein